MPPDGREFIVGKRGEVYLMDLQNDNHVAVQWKGGACTVDIRLDPAGPGEARLGPLACGGAP
jgi:outer membrane usher protein FimD/PapC